jgi:transcriptional regulator with XRE-family HTH domain
MKTEDEKFQQAVEVQRNCMRVRYEFAHAIKAEMEKRGMTQHQLAIRTGYHTNYINGVLHVRHNLEAATIIRIADAVGLTASFNLEPIESPTP